MKPSNNRKKAIYIKKRKKRLRLKIRKLILFSTRMLAFLIFIYIFSSITLKYFEDEKINIDSVYKPMEDTIKPSNNSKQFTVFIDPGHGFSDAGTESPKKIGYKVIETEITLDISLKIAEFLEKKDIKVILSRDNDYNEQERKQKEFNKLSYEQRTSLANNSNADIFISIHVNAYEYSSEPNGYEIYYCNNNESKSSDKQLLAESIMNSFKEYTKLDTVKIKTMEIEDAYYVVKHTKMPSVLFELGYCTNMEDASRLADEKWRTIAAESIADGIIKYYNEKQKI